MSLAFDRDAHVDRAVAVVRAGTLARDRCRRGGRGEVAAVFDRSLYLRVGADFVCIGEPAIGNGPTVLIVAAPVAELGVRQGQRARASAQGITIGNVLFDLAGCERWRTPRWPTAPSPAALLATCAEIARRAAADSPADSIARAAFAADDTPFTRVARPRVTRFASCLSEQPQTSSCPAEAGHPVTTGRNIWSRGLGLLDRPLSRAMTSEELLASAVGNLVGLGRGLTPSGDDFLIGALAVLNALNQTNAHAALGRAIVAALDRTSPLSASFLRAAAAGQTGENLHAMIAALVGGNADAAIAAAERIGHTSGWDALAGAVVTMRNL